MKKKGEKEVYIFRFESSRQAEYWMKQVQDKFHDSIIDFQKFQGRIEFEDSTYYFWSKNRVSKILEHATVYGPEDVYIILDDPHRKRLETFEESENQGGTQK